MTFKKGNTLGKKGTISREKKKQDLWAYVASGGAREYNHKLGELSKGVELTKPEEQFMDRSERLFQYVKAKKTDVTTDGKELPVPILGGIIKTDDNQKDS